MTQQEYVTGLAKEISRAAFECKLGGVIEGFAEEQGGLEHMQTKLCALVEKFNEEFEKTYDIGV